MRMASDCLVQRETDNPRCMTLERELKAKDASTDFATLIRLDARGDALGESNDGDGADDIMARPEAMRESLGLSVKAQYELMSVYAKVIAPITACPEAMDHKNNVIASPRVLGRIDESQNAAISAEDDVLVSDFAKLVSRSIADAGIADRRFIKGVIVYPMLMADLNGWKMKDFRFPERIIQAIKSAEKDKALREIIEALDMPVLLRAS